MAWDVKIGLRPFWDVEELVVIAQGKPSTQVKYSISGYIIYAMVNSIHIQSCLTGRGIFTSSSDVESTRGGINFLDVSSDGSRIVSSDPSQSKSTTIATIWDANTSEKLAKLCGHSARINSALFSLDGNSILTASDDHTVRIWSTTTGETDRVLEGHIGSVKSAIFTSDCMRIVSGSSDGTVCVWNRDSGRMEEQLAHNHEVLGVSASPSGDHIASVVSEDTGTTQGCLWDMTEGLPKMEPLGNVKDIKISPKGDFILITLWGTAYVRNIFTGAKISLSSVHDLIPATYSSDGSKIAFAQSADEIAVLDLKTFQQTGRCRLGSSTNSIREITYSPSGERLLVLCGRDNFHILNTDLIGQQSSPKRRTGERRGHQYPVTEVDILPGASYIVSRDASNAFCIWNATTGSQSPVPKSSKTLTVSSNGIYLAFELWGSPMVPLEIEIWSLIGPNHQTISRSKFQVYRGHKVESVSGDGQYLVTSVGDTKLSIWSISKGQEEWQLRSLRCLHAAVHISPDGAHLAIASLDTVHIWDMNTHLHVSALLEPSDCFCPGGLTKDQCSREHPITMSFSNDGLRIAYGRHTAVRIKSLTCGENLQTELIFVPPSSIGYLNGFSITFSENDGLLMAKTPGHIFLWNSHTGEIVETNPLCQTVKEAVIYHPRMTSSSLLIKDGFCTDSRTGKRCWIPPTYRNYTSIAFKGTYVCFGYESGEVVLLEACNI